MDCWMELLDGLMDGLLDGLMDGWTDGQSLRKRRYRGNKKSSLGFHLKNCDENRQTWKVLSLCMREGQGIMKQTNDTD